MDWKKTSINLKRKYKLPSIPERQYKKDWKGWGEFLGTHSIANQKIKFISYLEAKKIIKNSNFSSKYEYVKKFNKLMRNKYRIPKAPEKVYKTYWKGWDDFLGKK